MRRLASAAFAIALSASILIGGAFLVGDSRADLDASAQAGSGGVFTSRAEQIELLVPRGWRATDLPSYPGLLLWMTPKTPPGGQMVLTSETFTRELYCSWPVQCRMARDTSLVEKYACAIRAKLEAQRFRLGPKQTGPKENEAAGVPTVWFDFDDNKAHFLRQAIGLTPDRAISLVLAAPTNEARAAHVRHFDQALRTIRLLTAAETAAGLVDAGVADDDALAQIGDANTTIVPAPDAAGAIQQAPSPPARTPPIGPCP